MDLVLDVSFRSEIQPFRSEIHGQLDISKGHISEWFLFRKVFISEGQGHYSEIFILKAGIKGEGEAKEKESLSLTLSLTLFQSQRFLFDQAMCHYSEFWNKDPQDKSLSE